MWTWLVIVERLARFSPGRRALGGDALDLAHALAGIEPRLAGASAPPTRPSREIVDPIRPLATLHYVVFAAL